jgi:alkaline phosphatase D
MKSLLLLLLLTAGALFPRCQSGKLNTDQPQLKIAIGSCNRTDLPQVMWDPIIANNPDVFVWLGDIVYGDTHDMSALQSRYNKLSSEPGYQALVDQSDSVIGIWDDHDYGWNDAGKNYSKKDSSKIILANFLNIKADDPIMSRDGVYSSHTFGSAPISTKVILLDARYFRDTLIHSSDPRKRYEANLSGDILGEQQWAWLEAELSNSSADIHLIGSGIQYLPEEHGWEKWANFPKSRSRFLDLLSKYQPKNAVLLSGDRHIAELSRMDLSESYSITELTSSGLTHTWSQMFDESNKYRVGDLIAQLNFGVITISPDKILLEVRGEQDTLYKSHVIPIH